MSPDPDDESEGLLELFHAAPTQVEAPKEDERPQEPEGDPDDEITALLLLDFTDEDGEP